MSCSNLALAVHFKLVGDRSLTSCGTSEMEPLLHDDDQPRAGNALLDSAELDEAEPAPEAIGVVDDFQEIEPVEERIPTE